MSLDALYEKVDVGGFGQVELRATKDLGAGTTVMDLLDGTGELSQTRSLRTIELNRGHIDHPMGGFVNHHCHPTCIVDKDLGLLVTTRDVLKGEVINFDYMVNESEIDSGFQCRCGAPTCHGYIGTANSHISFLEGKAPVTSTTEAEVTDTEEGEDAAAESTNKTPAKQSATADSEPSPVSVLQVL